MSYSEMIQTLVYDYMLHAPDQEYSEEELIAQCVPAVVAERFHRLHPDLLNLTVKQARLMAYRKFLDEDIDIVTQDINLIC